MVRMILAAVLLLSLGSCGSIPFLSSSGGPNVNANVLAGKENTQQVVAQQNRQDAGRDIVTTEITKEVETERVEKLEISHTNIPPWVLLLLVLGWLLPTPSQIGQGFGNLVLSLFGKRSKGDS